MKTALRLLLAASLLTTATAAPPAADEGLVLSTLGALAGHSLVATYMGITEVGELYVMKVYDKIMVQGAASTYFGMTEASKENLLKLVGSGKLSADDTASMKELIALNDLLGKMADALIKDAKNPNAENYRAYETFRKKSANELSRVLGVPISRMLGDMAPR